MNSTLDFELLKTICYSSDKSFIKVFKGILENFANLAG